MAFGLYALQAHLRRLGAGDALSRAGLAFIVIGLITWFIAQGLALAIAIGLEDETVNLLTPLVVARVAITIIGGMATALGFFLFALALTATNLGNVWVTGWWPRCRWCRWGPSTGPQAPVGTSIRASRWPVPSTSCGSRGSCSWGYGC